MSRMTLDGLYSTNRDIAHFVYRGCGRLAVCISVAWVRVSSLPEDESHPFITAIERIPCTYSKYRYALDTAKYLISTQSRIAEKFCPKVLLPTTYPTGGFT